MGTSKKATLKTRKVRVTTNALQNIDEIIQYIAFVNFIYKITDSEVVILSVMHSSRNPSRIKGIRKIK